MDGRLNPKNMDAVPERQVRTRCPDGARTVPGRYAKGLTSTRLLLSRILATMLNRRISGERKPCYKQVT